MANELTTKDFQSNVLAKVKIMQDKKEVFFPANYSPENALKSAFLILQQTKNKDGVAVLDSCSKESIANALLDTVIQGLSPAKKQVYYVAYGKTLTAMRSYFGTIAVTKRLSTVKEVFAQVVYKGDVFEFKIESGSKKIIKHEQTLESINSGEIVAAYCTIKYGDNEEYSDIMTMRQIQTAWNRGQTKGQSSAHKDQPEEMAKRTVINRTCKTFANTSDDSDILIDAFNRTGNIEESEVVENVIENIEVPEFKPEIKLETKPEPTPEPTQTTIIDAGDF